MDRGWTGEGGEYAWTGGGRGAVDEERDVPVEDEERDVPVAWTGGGRGAGRAVALFLVLVPRTMDIFYGIGGGRGAGGSVQLGSVVT